MNFSELALKEVQQQTAKALTANGFTAITVETAEEAKAKALALIPDGAEVMNMTSVTLETIGLTKELSESTRFVQTRSKLTDAATTPRDKKRFGAAPEWAVGSVHALTQDGHLLIASNTGSQLPAYAYGSDHVIWIVGAQKIVKDTNEGIQRIYEYVLPREDKRAQAAYGMGSAVNHLLIENAVPASAKGRATVIIVNQALGF